MESTKMAWRISWKHHLIADSKKALLDQGIELIEHDPVVASKKEADAVILFAMIPQARQVAGSLSGLGNRREKLSE